MVGGTGLGAPLAVAKGGAVAEGEGLAVVGAPPQAAPAVTSRSRKLSAKLTRE